MDNKQWLDKDGVSYLWAKIKQLMSDGSVVVTRKTHEQWTAVGSSYTPANGEFIIYTTMLNLQGLPVIQNGLKIGDGVTPVGSLEFIAGRTLHKLTIGTQTFDGSSDVTVPIYNGEYE